MDATFETTSAQCFVGSSTATAGVTVSGPPVTELLPLLSRPKSIARSAFIREGDRWRADPGLARELADFLSQSTDDLPIP